MELPVELWVNIFKYIDLKTLSSLLCTNKYLKNVITPIKWDIIDSMLEKGCFIPKNLNTLFEYLYCVDWTTYVYNNMEIPEDVIVELQDYIDFSVITTKQKFSEKLIRQFFHKIPTINLLKFQKVPLDILMSLINSKINDFSSEYWWLIWAYQDVSVDFVNVFKSYVDWYPLSRNKNALSFDMINAFHNELKWHQVTGLGIHESIIEHYIYKMDSFCWKNVAYFSKLSEEFILRHQDKLDTVALFHSQQLSEHLIEYLLKKIHDNDDLIDVWSKISLNQALSMDFILKYKNELNLVFMIRNPNIKRKYLKLIYN